MYILVLLVILLIIIELSGLLVIRNTLFNFCNKMHAYDNTDNVNSACAAY